MMTVADRQIIQTTERMSGSSLFHAAESLFIECRDRHIWCRGCRSRKDCGQRWNQLVNSNDAFILSMREFNAFRRDLRRIEAEGYRRAERGSATMAALAIFLTGGTVIWLVGYSLMLEVVV